MTHSIMLNKYNRIFVKKCRIETFEYKIIKRKTSSYTFVIKNIKVIDLLSQNCQRKLTLQQRVLKHVVFSSENDKCLKLGCH